MSNYLMEVVPKPKEGSATVLKMNKKGNFALITGQGNNNYLCGKCKNTICQNIERGQVINLVFVCPNCGSYNLTRET